MCGVLKVSPQIFKGNSLLFLSVSPVSTVPGTLALDKQSLNNFQPGEVKKITSIKKKENKNLGKLSNIKEKTLLPASSTRKLVEKSLDFHPEKTIDSPPF